MEWIRKHENWWLLLLALVYGLFMVCYQLDYSAPWGDEWTEYMVSNLSLTNGSMYQTILDTFQPPLYNWLMHFWLKINDSIFWFRFFNVPLALISYLALYDLLAKLTSRWFGTVMIFFLASSFTFVYMVQEASEYALMMCLVFVQAAFFTRLLIRYNRWTLAGFVLSGVGAIYSQYGAVFASGIMFAAAFLYYLKKSTKKEWIEIGISYLIALVVFAAPLYLFFARYQIANNQITEHILAPELSLYGYFSSFGLLFEYFLIYPMSLDALFSILGVLFLAGLIVWLVFNWKKRDQYWYWMLVWFLSYSLLYLLVEMHIYAMIHAGESRGLFFRYSDCLLPVYYIALPVFIWKLKDTLSLKVQIVLPALFIAAMALVSFTGVGEIMTNWQKSHDDEFVEYWIAHDGQNTATLLLGRAWENGDYYFRQEGIDSNFSLTVEEIEQDQPEEFFVIRSVWGGEEEIDEIRQFAKGKYEVIDEILYPANGILDYGGELIHYKKVQSDLIYN